MFVGGLSLFLAVLFYVTGPQPSAASCAALKSQNDCNDDCGCGWCVHHGNISASCYTTYGGGHCVDGSFVGESNCATWNDVSRAFVIVFSVVVGAALLCVVLGGLLLHRPSGLFARSCGSCGRRPYARHLPDMYDPDDDC